MHTSRDSFESVGSEKWKQSWRRVTEKIRVYGAPPTFNPGLLLEDVPLEVARYPGAFVSRREVINQKDGVKFQSLAQWYSRGAVYDSERKILEEFNDPTDEKFDNPVDISGERVASAAQIRGRCMYLGTLHGHFGHFLVESLSRAWALGIAAEQKCPVLFHYAQPVRGQLFLDPGQIKLPSFILVVFEALGIGAGRLVLANQDLQVDELLVPRQQIRIGKKAFGAPGLPFVYDTIREQLLRRRSRSSVHPGKVYLTRTRLGLDKKHKSIANEQDVEELFGRYGFEIVAPEKLTLEEQIFLVSGATHIAGTTGSALHMALFNDRPDARVIAIDWRNNQTQYILEAARGLHADHIYCYDGRVEGDRPLVNVEMIERALTEVMGPPPTRSSQSAQQEWRSRSSTSQEATSHPAEKAADTQPYPSPDWLVGVVSALQRLDLQTGTINYFALAVCGLLASTQTSLGVQGNFLEFSLNPADQIFDVLALQSGERGLFRSTSRESELQRWDIAGVTKERQQRTGLFEELFTLDGEQAATFRWVHVDADSCSTLTFMRCSRLLMKGGVLVVSNFFDIEAPGVTASVFSFLAAEPAWALLVISPGLAFLVENSWSEHYERALRVGARSFLPRCGAFKISDSGPMHEKKLLAIRGNPNKLVPRRK